ncbi:hypothetical protein TGFOU_286270B [Toxoplasma gondii FOU]|uniref:Uncharacterized protein n=1 Tax=Toxoplasma gondii FOU TaxID=943167 RepID=A0A086LDS4_TOXGO|nr:hypothetical protein TGFOU_286270B [Toxoplasma gondii FOU]
MFGITGGFCVSFACRPQARNGPSLLACVLVERFVHSSVVNAVAVVLQQLSVSLSFYFPSVSSAVSILPTNSSAAAGVLAFMPSLSGAQFIPPSSFPLLLAASHFDEDATLPAYIRAILLCPAAAPFLERVKGPVLLSQLDRLAAIGRELVGGATEPCCGNAEEETQREERGKDTTGNTSSERGRAPQGRTASKRFEEKRDLQPAGGRPRASGYEDDNRDTLGDAFDGDACDARFCEDREKPKRELGTQNEHEEKPTSAGGRVSSRSLSSTRRDGSFFSLPPPAVSESACSSHSLSSRSLRSGTVPEGPRQAQLAADLSWTFQELQIAAAAALAACESGSVSSPLRFCAPRLTSRLMLRARAQQCMVAVVSDPAFFLALLVDLIQQRKGQQRREDSFQEAGTSERCRRTAFGSFSARPRKNSKNSLISGQGVAGFFSRSSPAVGRRREIPRKGAQGPRQEGGERRRREEGRATQRNAFILGERRRSIAEVLQVLERRRRREGVFVGVPAHSSLNARRHASNFRRQRASKHSHNACLSSSICGFPSCFSFPGDELERVSVEFGPSSAPSSGAVLIQRDVEIHSYLHGQALRVRSAPSLPNRTAELVQRLPLLLLLSHPQLVPLLPDFLQDSWPLNADALQLAGDAGHLQALTDAAVAAATASAGGSFLEDEREEGPEARAEEEEEDLGDRDAFFLTRPTKCIGQTPFRSDGEPERETAADVVETAAEVVETAAEVVETAAEVVETAAEVVETERLDESLEVKCGGAEEFQSETGDEGKLGLQAGQIGSDLLATCDDPETESHSPGRGCVECEAAAAKREEQEGRDRSVCLESRQQLRKPLDLAASTPCLQLCLRCEQHSKKRRRASLMAFLNSLFPPCYPSLASSLSAHCCSSPSAASVARALSRSRCPCLAEWACASRASESPFSPVGPQGSLSRFSSSPSCRSSTLLIEHASWADPFRLPMRNAPIFPPIFEALSSAGHEAEEGAEEKAFVEASATAAAVAACAALNAPPEATVKAVAEARAWSSRRLLRRIQSRQRRASSSDSHTASWAPTGVSTALATPRGGPGLAFLLRKRPLGSPSDTARDRSQLSSSSEAGDKRGDENSENALEDRSRRGGADTVFEGRLEASRASPARRPEGVETLPRKDDAVGPFYDERSPIAFEKPRKDFERSPPFASPASPTTVAGMFAPEKGDASRSSASFFSSRFSARSYAASSPRWLLGVESFQPHMVGSKGLSIALLQQSPIRGCLSATAAVPFDAFERTLRHSVNREARRKLQQIISALDLSGDMEKLRRSRNAAKAAATAARAGAAVARAMGQEAPDGALAASAVAGGETVFLHTVLQLERLLKRARHLVRSLHLPPDAFRDLYLFSNSPDGAEGEAGRRTAGPARETGPRGRREAERREGERSEAAAETAAEPGSSYRGEGRESERARDGRGKERGDEARGSRRRSMTAPETARGDRETGRQAAETARCEERGASDDGRTKARHAEEQRRIKHRQAKLKSLLQQNPEHLWNCVKNVWCTIFSPSVVLALQRAQLRFSQIRIAVILQLVDGICEASFLCRTDIGSLYSRTPREQAADPSLRLSHICDEKSRSRGRWPEGPVSLRASAGTGRKPHTPRNAPAASETAEGYHESSTGSGTKETLRHPHGDRSESPGGAHKGSSATTEETEARKPHPGWLERTPHIGDTFSSPRSLRSLSGSESPRSSGEAGPSSCECSPCGCPEIRELYGEVTLGLGLAPRELLEGAVASPGEPLLFRARYTADPPFGASLWGAGGDCGGTVRRPEEGPGASADAVGVLREQSAREEQAEEKEENGQATREGSQEGRGREGLLSSGWTREATPSSARGVHASSTSGVRFSLESETPQMSRMSWSPLDRDESGQEPSAAVRSRGSSCASLASSAGQASRPPSRCLCCRALSEACRCTETRTGSRVAPPRVERFPSASTLLRCPSACILVSADLNVEGLETMMAVDGVMACIQHQENAKCHLVEPQDSRASSASSPQSGESPLRPATPAALPVGGTVPQRWRVEYRQEKWISDQTWRDARLLQAAAVAVEAEKALGFPQVVHGMWVRSAGGGATCGAGDALVLLSSRCVPAVQQEAVEETRML